jgi:hypothetical protein
MAIWILALLTSERSSQEKKAGNEGHSVEEIGPVEVIHR